jgi:hypothetical protein
MGAHIRTDLAQIISNTIHFIQAVPTVSNPDFSFFLRFTIFAVKKTKLAIGVHSREFPDEHYQDKAALIFPVPGAGRKNTWEKHW